MLDKTPKIFISYSWDSETTRTITRELAELLLRDGIDVVIDIWDLKPGQDMYSCMEQSYLKSRMYIDLSGDHYESGYEQLLRTLYTNGQKEENLRLVLLQNVFSRKNPRRCYK